MPYNNDPPSWYYPANPHAGIIPGYNPAWSIDNAIWNMFPGALVLQGRFRNHKDVNRKMQSDLGQKFVYNKFSVPTYELAFIINDADLQILEAFQLSVIGESTPFYLSLLGDGTDSVYVRKEDNFEPVETGQKTFDGNSGQYLALYSYVLRMEQEVHPWPGET